MDVLELPKPLLPLNPLFPPQQPRIPRALGDVFVGRSRLKFPGVQLQAPKEAPDQASQRLPAAAPEGVKAPDLTYTGAAKTTGAALGLTLDLKA